MQNLIADGMRYLAIWKEYRIIKQSGLFDAAWYQQTYTDVIHAKLSPLWHYVLVGSSVGYNPSAHFDGAWYLAQNPDVAQAGISPFVHYITAGQFEARLPHAPCDTSVVPSTPDSTPNSTEWRVRELVAHLVMSAVHNEFPPYTSQDIFREPSWQLPQSVPVRRPDTYYLKLFHDAMDRFDSQYDGDKLDAAYLLLCDLYSRQLFLSVLVGRLLGATKYRLPIHYSHVWRMYPQVIQCGDRDNGFLRGNVMQYKQDLVPIGHDLRMFSAPMSVFINFLLEQYNYKDLVCAKQGDVVIDGGAFLGETALYFAERVGLNGKVYAFEFIPSNIDVIVQNIAMNPQYQQIVHVVDRPLWSDSVTQLAADDRGPGSALRTTASLQEILFTTIAIDDFVRDQDISRVDFIKLDIEGAELSALEGARSVITKYKPQLAICIYHKDSDFWQIPLLLHEMVPEYEFYVDHFVPFPKWETVLFARVRS